MGLPKAHYRCHACNDLEVFHLPQHLRLVGKTFICEECYYDELATQGVTAFTKGPSFKSFPTLSKIMRGKL